MTTFTTEDRILAEKDGSYTLNVEGGTVTASPPHIVDSGASVINNKPVAYITQYDLERLPLYDCWVNGEKSKGSVPLYTHSVKELTDEEIWKLWVQHLNDDIVVFARAILRKAQQK